MVIAIHGQQREQPHSLELCFRASNTGIFSATCNTFEVDCLVDEHLHAYTTRQSAESHQQDRGINAGCTYQLVQGRLLSNETHERPRSCDMWIDRVTISRIRLRGGAPMTPQRAAGACRLERVPSGIAGAAATVRLSRRWLA